ncbi:MAG: hypothetical protein SNJ71_01285 [Bacteroidales bacterium]
MAKSDVIRIKSEVKKKLKTLAKIKNLTMSETINKLISEDSVNDVSLSEIKNIVLQNNQILNEILSILKENE